MAQILNKLMANYKRYRKPYQILMVPLVLSIIPLSIQTDVANCAFVILLMSIYWILECVPIAITSLLPVFLFPFFGIIKSKEISPLYFQDSIMFIFASIVVGIGIETSGLHEKLALKVCILSGSDPKWILLGIISSTSFLSVWISNTATASMILPISISIVKQIAKFDPTYNPDLRQTNSSNSMELAIIEKVKNSKQVELKMEKEMDSGDESIDSEIKVNEEIDPEEAAKEVVHHNIDEEFKSKEAKNLVKGFCLAVTFASTAGGSASLIGTSSNIAFKIYFDENHQGDDMNFLTFLLYSFPISFLNTFLLWILICVIWLPKGTFSFKKKVSVSDKPNNKNRVSEMIKHSYEKLGPYSWEQKSIGTMFILLVAFWLTRDLTFVPGWQIIFKKDYVTDTSAAIMMMFVASCWPKQNIFKGHDYQPLLIWKDVQRIFSWNVIFLVGGSLAMAKGFDKSGFSTFLGDVLTNVAPSSEFLTINIVNLICSIGTEFVSNVSMVLILLPVLDKLAISKSIEYHRLLLPQAIAANYSFMFPASCAANAIAYNTGYLALKDMMLTGFLMKVIGILTLMLADHSWLLLIFNYPNNGFPISTTKTALNITTQAFTACS